MKKILKNLEKISLERQDFDYGNEQIVVNKKHGSFMFEFVVRYYKNVKNYISFTYEQPEECDIEFVVTDVCDVDVLGFRNNGLELTDEELEKLTDALKNMFVGKKY